MQSTVSEEAYPLSFRQKEATVLGNYLQKQRSVELVGMKRVGINNFLKFFLFHQHIKEKYLPKDGKHCFILIDLNDLLERELFPFWRLTFKRIADAVEDGDFSTTTKKKIAKLFLASIQSGDLFLTYDGLKEALVTLANDNIYPTLFFSRFDRLIEAATPEFFNNLQSLRDATHHKITYVFTSYRQLDSLMPDVFHRKDFSLFSNVLYIEPLSLEDSLISLVATQDRYQVEFSAKTKEFICKLAGGYVQYLQIFPLILSEHKKSLNTTYQELFDLFQKDERVTLQSEELWESLSDSEKNILLKVVAKKKLTKEDQKEGAYLWETGLLIGKITTSVCFSPVFEEYVKTKGEEKSDPNNLEFSKKEHMLFQVLQEHVNEIAEREEIVEKVWPEYKEYGVSDWSIDRLVARVRNKLKKQKSPYEIQTIRTRGYKLLSK